MRKDKLRSRNSIFNAAKQAFAKNGIDGISFDEIGQIAGISRGTLYNHFKNKEDLITQMALPVLDEGIRLFSEEPITTVEQIAEKLTKYWYIHGESLSVLTYSRATIISAVRNKHHQFMKVYQKAFNSLHASRPLPSGVQQSMKITFTTYIPLFNSLCIGDPPITGEEYARILEGILYWRQSN